MVVGAYPREKWISKVRSRKRIGQRMKVLVTGKNGQIARSLADCAEGHPALSLVFASRSDTDVRLDLEDEPSIRLAVQTVKPDIIINAAAYTQVDQAEDEPEKAMQINAIAPGILAEEANKYGAAIIQISTDYVFDGTLDRPYRPTDKTNPIGSYGVSKLRGEQTVRAATDDFIIIRTAWIYSSYGKNFYKRMLRLAVEDGKVSVVTDQIGNPTHAKDIAEGLLRICDKLRMGENQLLGTVQHLVGPEEMTRFDFAQQIFADNNLNCIVEPITTEQRPTKAMRPANSRLISTL